MSVAGLVAPPLSVPLPLQPRQQGNSSIGSQQQQLQHQQILEQFPQLEGPEPPFVSRYRTLRGKSVSTPRLRAELEVYEDDVAAAGNGSPSLRRRSKSFVAQRRGNAAPKAPPTFALTPKPINLPIAVKKKLVSAKSTPANIYKLKAGNVTRVTGIDDENAAPPPLPKTRSRASTRESVRWAEEVARLEAETDRILAEQKKLDLARLQAQLALAKSPPSKPKRLILGKLTFLSRNGKRSASNSSSVPGTPSTTAPTLFSLDLSRDTTPASSPSPDRMHFIEMGGKGIVPQTDAPTSAINGGDRRVTVRCLSSTINLPVTAETSPVDIIYAAANFTTHQIDPASCILVECYVVFGLERRLRRYERIRDIMNSWDRDQQNTLLIMPLDGSEDISELDMSSVRRTEEAPQGFTMHLYHSSRPGKWSKRWVTLMENGQIFACKKADGKASDKESQSLAHLSDFDIYNPRESEMKRHLKPPKRFCYAIKSQQKTAVFSNNTENFVHFFSTDDAAVARRFQEMVHAWRSWYLVNKQVDLRKKDRALPPTPQSSRKSSGVSRSATHRKQESTEEKPYMLGQFKPLMDMDPFDKPMEEFGKAFEEEARAVQEKVRAEQDQLAQRQRSKTLTKPQIQPLQMQMPPTPKSPQEFSSGGLLGDGYEKRKQVQTTTTPTSPLQDGPFTNGPSLLQQAASKASKPEESEAQSWFPSASEHTARSRSHSMRSVKRPMTAEASRPPMPQQPLLKLSQEDARRPTARLGNPVKPTSGGPLINFATGGPTANVFQDGPPRGVPRSYTGGRVGAPPQAALSARPRSKSTSQQSGRRIVSAEDRPPVPALPHRSGRRDGMPYNGNPRVAVGSTEPLVNHAR